MIEYRFLREDEIERSLFKSFIRRQVVTKCRRWENGEWVIKDAPFIDDWSESDYAELIFCLRNTVRTGGAVLAAFYRDNLKGFASVEARLFGGENGYLDLTALHVSEDMRRQGVGSRLFCRAADWAREHGAKKLYISAHSAVESQLFYKKMGCVQAVQYNMEHVEKEPYDCQLEYVL